MYVLDSAGTAVPPEKIRAGGGPCGAIRAHGLHGGTHTWGGKTYRGGAEILSDIIRCSTYCNKVPYSIPLKEFLNFFNRGDLNFFICYNIRIYSTKSTVCIISLHFILFKMVFVIKNFFIFIFC